MNTLVFIGILIAITYFFTSSSNDSKAKKRKAKRTASTSGSRKASASTPLIDKGEMLRCHNCGAFFPESRAVRSQVQEVELHFCSQNCKSNFRVE